MPQNSKGGVSAAVTYGNAKSADVVAFSALGEKAVVIEVKSTRMPYLSKTIFAATGFWLLASVLLFVFPNVIPLVSGLVVILSIPVAVVLTILTMLSLIKEEKRLWPSVAGALIVAVFFFALPRLMYWGALAHLYLHKRTYETTAQRMLSARNDAERRTICGEQCWLLASDRGPVAFHYIHGFLAWHDIIYDPSGKVLGSRSGDKRKRVDTYFISADHLTGDWYLGHFGD